MTPLAIYLAKLFLCSGILYGYYHIALRNNKFHHWNRFYLIAITIISIILPLVNIPIARESNSPQLLYYTANMFTTTVTTAYTPTPSAFNFSLLLYVIYAAIATVFLFRIAFSVLKLLRLIKHSSIVEIPPYHMVENKTIKTPFSFFNYIFWDTTPIDSLHGQQILRHELVHLREKHSSDKLFMEIITAIGWINPFFHLIKKELTLVHEFLADKKAAGKEVGSYAEIILQAAFQSNQFTITNNFFQSPIKRRILMLTKFHHPRFSYMRRILVLPLGAFVFCSLAFVADSESADFLPPNDFEPVVINIPSTAKPTSFPAVTKPSPTLQNKGGEKNTAFFQEVHSKVDVLPTYKGGEQALMQFLSQNIKYPKEAQDKNVQGTVFVQFHVGTDGSISNIKTVGNDPGSGLSEEAVRVVKLMPVWNPGKIKDKSVITAMTLPIKFALEPSDKEKTYTFVSDPPQFPGGEEALAKYLSSNIKFPKAAKDAKASGLVRVKFIVNTDGELTDVTATGSKKGYGFEEEGERVVKAMPRWIPGKQEGKPVNVVFNLPIRFNYQ